MTTSEAIFLCAKLNLLNIKWKKCITIFLCTAATSLSIVSNFTSVFFPPSPFLLHKFRFQNSGNVCMWVVATEYSLLACLTPSSLALIRSVSRKPLCKTELLDYNTFSARKNPNKQKKRKQGQKRIIRRCRGSNPGHPRDRREYLPLYYNDHQTSQIQCTAGELYY